MNAVVRTFEDSPAIRAETPLFIGLDGPSGGGKTYSALRLATGIQRVAGGDIWGIDTESNRMLHYADKFKFRHVPFRAPFGPLDYLAAIEHCVAKGAKTIIVDSMSHEHEGPGGVLEMHQAEMMRLSELWRCPPEKAQMAAWAKPKSERRRLINTIMQINANFVFCFRAKEKLRIVRGKDPVDLGYMPIAGEEFIFEMMLCCLLPPGAKGVPRWESDYEGERSMMKLPGQFVDLFGAPRQLDEDTGAKLAQWAAGTPPAPSIADYEACKDQSLLDELEARRAANWKAIPAAAKTQLKAAADAAQKRIKEAPAVSTNEPQIGDDDLLKAAETKVELEEIWARVKAKHEAAGTEIDLNADFAYHTRKEQLDAPL
jgi:hypothetical protein